MKYTMTATANKLPALKKQLKNDCDIPESILKEAVIKVTEITL